MIDNAQYHAGLDKLWAALGLTTTQDTDVFTLAAERIRSLEAGVWVIINASGQLGCNEAFHNKMEAERVAKSMDWQVQRLRGAPQRAKFLRPCGHVCARLVRAFMTV